MPFIGPRAAIDLALPAGVDAGRILAFQMRNGTTAQEVIARAASVIGAVNEEIGRNYGGFTYLTPLDHAIYRVGDGSGRRMTPVKVEFKEADPIRSDIIGHMLPLEDYEDATAWTPIYLRDAWDAHIDADLREIADSWRARIEVGLFTRILTQAELQIGSAGWSVGWAIGSGTNVNFIPPKYGQYVFDSTHSHYVRVNAALSVTSTVTALEETIKHMRHHGHTGRLVALVSETDVAMYTGMAAGKFVKLQPQGITVVAGNAGAPVNVVTGEIEGVPGELFGMFMSDRGVVELRYHPIIPTGYGFVTKSYGNNSPKNGVALREHPAQGFGLVPDPILTRSINPQLELVKFKAIHGIGTNDRTNGVAFHIASGGTNYVDPTV